MSTFLVSIEGLTVRIEWKVGPVVIGPASVVTDAVRQQKAPSSAEWFNERVAELGSGACAMVEAVDRDAALDLVAQAVDVLRVLQHVRHFKMELTQFGIAGDIGSGVVSYMEIDPTQSWSGSFHRGNPLGWTFNDPDEWANAPVFQWAASAIGASSPSESQRRALIGIQLLSQAIVERRGTFKMVELVGALEAWLLPRRANGQTFRLARAVAFFGCGRQGNDLCGRSRDTCPYLELNPDVNAERNKLKQLRVQGAQPPRRCAEWHRVVDWYEDRSGVVHGSGLIISYKEASNALYWVCLNLAEPILHWLTEHPTDCVAALDDEIAALPPAPDWEVRIGSQI